MCVIAGIIELKTRRPINESLLAAMNDRLQHRGPDGSGLHVEPGIGLAHRRLSIVDLAAGHQPMYNEDNSVCIVFNGEIYNFQGLVQELTANGYENQTVQIRQGAKTQSAPMQELEAAVLDGRLHHDGNPVLRWCVGNVIARADRNGNIAPDREADAKKIDCAVALINAMVRGMLGGTQPYTDGEGLTEL